LKKETELLPKGTKCEKCGEGRFVKETDIIDVWFDSGISHQAVLKKNKDLGYPSDLYLEGSDQHRGWFQSALITAMAIAQDAPYKSVLTHGFVVDGEGKKMSKSLGNVLTPEEVMKKYGADILRLWVASSDYTEDVRLSDEILTRLADAYRKIRNTFKYLLSNLYDFDSGRDTVGYDDMLEIDRWILSKLSYLIEESKENYEACAFHKVYRAIYNFCVYEISSVYLDILKDRMYTFRADSTERRSGQTAMFELAAALLKITAPLLTITTDEAWTHLKKEDKMDSIHLEPWPDEVVTKGWFDKTLNEKWRKLITVREVVLKKLEEKRESNEIGSSLEAKVVLGAKDADYKKLLNENKDMLRYLFIVSRVELIEPPRDEGHSASLGFAERRALGAGDLDYNIPVAVEIKKAKGKKCIRCWNYSEAVGMDEKHPSLCERCITAIKIGV